MSYTSILMDVSDGIGTVTLNVPERRNPLGEPVTSEVVHALNALAADAACRVVVVTGVGKAFCAGADLKGLQQVKALDDRAAYNHVIAVYKTIMHHPRPVIASVNGDAVGAGVVSFSDMAISSDKARFGYPEILRGLTVGVTMVSLLRTVPRKHAFEMALTGKLIDAQEAWRLGLVNRVVPHDELPRATREMALHIASLSPEALRLCKETILMVQDVEFNKALLVARDQRVLARLTEDAEEGVRAFLEKRPPQWKGR
ncbi:MAG: enoyl-CoA hydratase-related protein [Dehalococcoidia bacterium]|nr:enoyl-CoA hydratase-related protein [Dehalococcoidia bacterium]